MDRSASRPSLAPSVWWLASLERLAARRAWPWLPHATGALVLAGGLVTLPLAVPVLPVDRLIAYVQAIGWAMWPAPLAAPEQLILVGAIADRAPTWFDDVARHFN